MHAVRTEGSPDALAFRSRLVMGRPDRIGHRGSTAVQVRRTGSRSTGLFVAMASSGCAIAGFLGGDDRHFADLSNLDGNPAKLANKPRISGRSEEHTSELQ